MNRMTRFGHEVATAWTRLRMRPAYALLAGAMLAVAIASNVAVFSVLSRTLLRSFPFDDRDLVMVFTTHRDASGEQQEFPSGSIDYVHWSAESVSFEGLEIIRVFAGSITDRGETEAVRVGSVSGGIFGLLRVRPAIGSDFIATDDRPNANAVVLAHDFWQRRLGGDRSVVGRTVTIDGQSRVIRGVMPRGFEIPNSRADVYVPAGFSRSNMPSPGSRAYSVFARLKKGNTPQTAAADLQRISRELEKKYPVSHKDYSAAVKPLREALFGEQRAALLTLFIAVLLVHVLACVNVANLMLAQISDQRAVTAVRLAIGAPPGQIVRYRLIESLLLSAGSAIAGLILGNLAVAVILRRYADPELLASQGSAAAVGAFALVLTLLTAVATSLLPALGEAKQPISALINEGSQRSSSSPAQRRARELFITAEVALAIPLLIGAAVAVKRLHDLRTFDIGFRPDGIMTAQMILPARYDREARSRFAAEVVRRLESSPGVVTAAITTSLFRIDGGASTVVRSETMADHASVGFRRITPHFFETMASPLVAGRAFDSGDVADAPAVAIVSESFARQFWPRQNPIGKKLIRQSANSVPLTVVGVARDIRDIGVAEDPGPVLYTPFLQNNNIYVSIVARTNGDPAVLRDPIRKAVQSIDHTLAPSEVLAFRQLVDETLGAYKLQVALLGGFAVIALALAATGIFAITAYAVSRRMPEIGVRLAFGASPRDVVTELLGAAAKPVLAGVLAGSAITLAALRAVPAIATFASGIDPRYAATVVSLLVGSAFVATLVPALRARSARPSELLRRA